MSIGWTFFWIFMTIVACCCCAICGKALGDSEKDSTPVVIPSPPARDPQVFVVNETPAPAPVQPQLQNYHLHVNFEQSDAAYQGGRHEPVSVMRYGLFCACVMRYLEFFRLRYALST